MVRPLEKSLFLCVSSLSKNTFFLKEKYGKKWRGVTTKKCQLSPAPTGFSISMVRCRERTILQKKIFVFSKIFFIIFYRLINFCCGQVVEPLSTFCGYVCQNFVFLCLNFFVYLICPISKVRQCLLYRYREISQKNRFLQRTERGFHCENSQSVFDKNLVSKKRHFI